MRLPVSTGCSDVEYDNKLYSYLLLFYCDPILTYLNTDNIIV